MQAKFYICKQCGNIVEMIRQTPVPIMCCGQKMVELIANTSDGAVEKHVPEMTIVGNKVDVVVGSVLHPMIEQHYIQWIYIKTNKGIQRRELLPGNEPKASFVLDDGEFIEDIYEYCNLHGLWKR